MMRAVLIGVAVAIAALVVGIGPASAHSTLQPGDFGVDLEACSTDQRDPATHVGPLAQASACLTRGVWHLIGDASSSGASLNGSAGLVQDDFNQRS